MSDHPNVRNLHTGPTVPNFQHQAPAAAPAEIAPSVMEQIIAETERRLEARVSRPSPFDPKNFEEIEAFAERVCRSGFLPKSYKDSRTPVDDVIMAVLMGKEVGISAMAALQSIAVVNGRPTLWGEAVPGLCIKTGQVVDFREWFEGEENTDAFTAHCEVTRRGISPKLGSFSLSDVRRAGLKSVHTTYPKDMVMWRARHRAWHAAFPDTLRGLGTAEIERDEAERNAFKLPRPEQAWSAKREGEPDWDTAWINAAVQRLSDTQDSWQWLEALMALQGEAPTGRDLEELEKLPGVQATIPMAPENVRSQIATGFLGAAQRFIAHTEATPAKEAPPPPANKAPEAPKKEPAKQEAPIETASSEPQSPEFEYAVLDETGEPVDGVIHTDPVLWAHEFAAHADPRSMGYMAMREHNADALQDAAQMSAGAATVIGSIEAEANIKPDMPPADPVVIEPTLSRGKPDWAQYQRDLTAAYEGESAATFPRFTDAQRDRIGRFPQAIRLAATKIALERARALGITMPPGFTEAPKEAKQEEPPPANDAAPPADAPPPANGDKDTKLMATFADLIAACADVHSVRQFTNQTTVTATLNRWEREGKTDYAQALRNAVANREAELRAPRNG